MTRPGPLGPAARLVLATSLVWAACNPGSTVVLPPLEVVIASGDEQYGTPGQTLGTPLRVMVRTLTGGVPKSGTTVTWDVLTGDAAIVGVSTTQTDATGSAEARIRLGSSTGDVVVRATAHGPNQPTNTFHLFNVDVPVLSAVSPSVAAPGTSIVVSGQNFSPVADQNVVLFSGIRGRVTAASTTQLTVSVPMCLPARNVSLTVQLGVVASTSLPLGVGAGGDLTSLAVGGVSDVTDDAGFTCLGLPGDGAEYLAVVYSTSTVGAARHPATLRGLSSAPTPLADAQPGVVQRADRDALPELGREDPQLDWDRRLREVEARATKARGPTASVRGGASSSGPEAAPPAVGERRSFEVYAGEGDFTSVTGVVRLVSEHAAVFVDESAPAGGFTTADLQLFADRFDDVIHPTVTGVFGSESDLDGNERVVILFTPAVNALTPRGAAGFVGGFFFGIDLLPEQQGSNDGEVFYALVPDPTGIHSDPRPKAAVLNVVPAILAHEFQHMVHFNERVLVRGAESTEAVWLSEGLAQYAEELVAEAYDGLGDATVAELFRSGARARARRYLGAPDTVSVIIALGEGTLEERGAGYLLVAYLQDQEGTDLLTRLTRTTRTGVGNVEAETGRRWADVLIDWWSAVYLDGPGVETGRMVYPSLDLRAFLGNPFPLEPVALGGGDFSRSDSLWSSSAGYYIVTPPTGGSTTVRVSGEAGGPSSRHAGLRMRVIRIR